jgi:negative regulator of flagellin synthesis FlgM
MKITGTDNEIARHIGETVRPRTKEPADKPRTPADVPKETTEDAIVNLSQRAKEIQMARQAMESEPDIRSEKVQAIKKQIKNGTYEIDYDKTAEEMLKAFSD